jgi:dTDP-glucose 4,6-dehydratase
MVVSPLLADDVRLLVGSPRRWEALRGARVFLTGGTGFVGRWLLAAFVHANREHALDARVDVLTRDPDAFAHACPDLVPDDAVALVPGDVRTADASRATYTHVIHGAAPSDAGITERRPLEILEIIETGTRRVLELSSRCRARRFLLLSSGAVYGPPAPRGGFVEGSPRGPLWPTERSAYHAGKRSAEDLTWAAHDAGLSVTVARLFAFVGPHLPLDRHFAIGNFIADALAGRTIRVRGDGSPVRSYLYAADMAAWLWMMLLDERAAGATYNVGSERSVSIAETARLVAAESGAGMNVTVLGGGERGAGDWYVPSTKRARDELDVAETVDLPEAVRRTIAWSRLAALPPSEE